MSRCSIPTGTLACKSLVYALCMHDMWDMCCVSCGETGVLPSGWDTHSHTTAALVFPSDDMMPRAYIGVFRDYQGYAEQTVAPSGTPHPYNTSFRMSDQQYPDSTLIAPARCSANPPYRGPSRDWMSKLHPSLPPLHWRRNRVPH